MARAAEWAERVKAWRRSGLTSEQYAERHSLSARSLLWWSSQLRRRGLPAEPSGSGVTLARVIRREPAVGSVASSAVVIELQGARVLVGSGAEPATVMMAIAALRASTSPERGR